MLKRGWNLFKKRIVALIVVEILAVITVISIFNVSLALFPYTEGVIMSVLLTIPVIGCSLAAFHTLIVNKDIGVCKAIGLSFQKTHSYLWLSLLMTVLITFAYALVIPGMIFTVWFFLAPGVLAAEGTGGMNALLKSKSLVKGIWPEAALRVLIIMIIVMFIKGIPLVGRFLWGPVLFILAYTLYEDVSRTEGEISFNPAFREKLFLIGIAAGSVLIPLVVTLLFLHLFEGSFDL